MLNVIAKLLSFTRLVKNGANVSDVKVDPGGGANITAEHFAPPGDDSYPLPGDYVLGVGVPRSGSKAAAGYIDPKNAHKSNEGDKRIYGRNGSGDEVNQVWLQNDGSIFMSNDNASVLINADGSIAGDNGAGSFELQVSGTMNINGATIDPAGNITSPGIITAGTSVVAPVMTAASSLTVSGKEMKNHTHAQGNDSDGDSQVNTGGPV